MTLTTCSHICDWANARPAPGLHMAKVPPTLANVKLPKERMRAILLTILTILIFPGGTLLRVQTQSNRPAEQIIVGPLDPDSPQGLVLVTGREEDGRWSQFGIRLLVYKSPGQMEEMSPLTVVGPQAADGSFGSLSWYTSFDEQTPLTLRWSRRQPQTIIAQVTGPSKIRVALEIYRPRFGRVTAGNEAIKEQSWSGFLALEDRSTLIGEQLNTGTRSSPRRRFMLKTDRAANGAATYRNASLFREQLVSGGIAREIKGEDSASSFSYAALSFDLAERNSFSFVMTAGEQWETMEQDVRSVISPSPGIQKEVDKGIIGQLDESEARSRETRPGSSGAIGENLDLIARHLIWNRFFDPLSGSTYLAPFRREWSPVNIGNGPELTADSLFMAIMSPLIDPTAATSTLRLILESQLTDGRVPPVIRIGPGLQSGISEAGLPAGRSMLPLASYGVLKTYIVTGDLQFLAWAYPRLRRWNEWWQTSRSDSRGEKRSWRDGNSDGLLELGYNEELELGTLSRRQLSTSTRKRLALSESGFERPDDPDVVFNESSSTLEQNSIALNSLYALDIESLSIIARELGLTADADQLDARIQRLRALINSRLWDEELGCYVDRRWNGQAVRRLTPENFYPLLAGLPDPERLKRMMAVLSDEKRLGLPAVFPSLARNDPGYDAGKPGAGAVIPGMNYLLYLGLRRQNQHVEAAAVARQNLLLSRTARERLRPFPDYFSSFDGHPLQIRRSPGRISGESMMIWPAIEELICADPLNDQTIGGLTIGSLDVTEESRIDRIQIGSTNKSRIDLVLGPRQTSIRRDGRVEIECDGAVRLRGYRRQERSLAFVVETSAQVRISIPGEAGRKITVSVDKEILGSTSIGAAASFRVGRGSHRILIFKG